LRSSKLGLMMKNASAREGKDEAAFLLY